METNSAIRRRTKKEKGDDWPAIWPVALTLSVPLLAPAPTVGPQSSLNGKKPRTAGASKEKNSRAFDFPANRHDAGSARWEMASGLIIAVPSASGTTCSGSPCRQESLQSEWLDTAIRRCGTWRKSLGDERQGFRPPWSGRPVTALLV